MIRISHSLRTAFRECPRKVFYRYHAGIVKRVDASPALVIGKCFHHGLEEIRKGTNIHDAVMSATTKLAVESKEVIEQEKGTENEIKLKAYLLGYESFFNEKYRSYESELQVDGVDNSTIAFIDAVYVKDSRAVIVEDKTTAAFNDDMNMILKMNDQTLWYWSELDRIGYDVAEISFRETKKSAHKINKKETLDEFRQRIGNLYFDQPDLHYREIVLRYSPDQIGAYRKMIQMIDCDIRRICGDFTDDVDSVFCNGFSCSGKYSSCAYLPICYDKNNIHNRYVLRDNYEPWDGGVFASKYGIETKTQLEQEENSDV